MQNLAATGGLRTVGRWIAKLSFNNLMKSTTAGMLAIVGVGLLTSVHLLWGVLDPDRMILVAGRPRWLGSLAILLTWFGVSVAFQGWGKWLKEERLKEHGVTTELVGGVEGAVMTVSLGARLGMWLWFALLIFGHILALFR